MREIYRKILSLLTPHEKRRGLLVMVMVTAMAVLEIAGIASVMPFLSVLGNPEVVRENAYLTAVYNALQFQSVDTFLMALGGAVFALVFFSALFRSVTHYAMNRFIEMRRYSIGERLLETYLRQPYAFFLNRHSSDMAKSILSEVDQLVNDVLRPGVEMVAYGVVLIGLITLLVVVDPVLAIILIAVLGGLYGVIYLVVQRLLGRIGIERVKANQARFTRAGEALGGIKDIKLLGREHAYLKGFRRPANRFARYMATNQTISQVPNFLVEAVALGGIIAITLILLASHGGVAGGGLGGLLPVLGLYAFAGLRMKPAAQKVYQGMARLRFGAAAVNAIHEDLCQRAALAELHQQTAQPWKPFCELALQGINYAYPNVEANALSGIDLAIPVGTSVGLVGSTGAGKTTLVDVLLGLLRPTQGVITVDGKPVTDVNIRAYQQALGYVPQDIYLTDSTVAENIALGIPTDEIDHEQVIRCAQMAQVHEFIMQDLPQQYETVVGERGVRLSGGQRQRIGIARALYHEPSVLVFDEATSALDTVTERAVMEAIKTLHHQKTVILIAHRLSTVRECDRIFLLEKGELKGQGTFDELSNENERFRAMVADHGT